MLINLEGTVIERDYTSGLGIVFLEENVPFRIEVGGGLGSQEMSLPTLESKLMKAIDNSSIATRAAGADSAACAICDL